jgi:hypothetical protein
MIRAPLVELKMAAPKNTRLKLNLRKPWSLTPPELLADVESRRRQPTKVFLKKAMPVASAKRQRGELSAKDRPRMGHQAPLPSTLRISPSSTPMIRYEMAVYVTNI